jgi:predicted enzyme related to lactoylglutathione lyase
VAQANADRACWQDVVHRRLASRTPSAPPCAAASPLTDDLDGVLQQAKAEGVEPIARQDGEYGRFASIIDPAGVKVELWQPPEAVES